MNPLVRQYINFKLNNLTMEELFKLTKLYQISMTREQAKKVLIIMNKEQIDIANKKQLSRLLNKIGSEVNKDIEAKIRYLLSVLYE